MTIREDQSIRLDINTGTSRSTALGWHQQLWHTHTHTRTHILSLSLSLSISYKMKFLSVVSLCIASVAVTASPVARRDAGAQFHLKTTDSSIAAHNNLYVFGFHTGAGLNDAVLTTEASDASPAVLNDTTVSFQLGTEFPWGLVPSGESNYGGMLVVDSPLLCSLHALLTSMSLLFPDWESVAINAGEGSKNFLINNNQLTWNYTTFSGWFGKFYTHTHTHIYKIQINIHIWHKWSRLLLSWCVAVCKEAKKIK